MSYDNPSKSSKKSAAKNRSGKNAAAKLRPSWPKSAADYTVVLVDDPAPHVRRITMNRPDKRNALNHDLRAQILHALRAADQDPSVHVMIVRGAGPSFSAGYDLGGGNEGVEYPFFTPEGEGQYPRHVTETWMSIWELSKPVIAQV
ncbi:MAG: enoyl-CoA hydratase/isomerase family protein, partial [Myxococcota bacterium]